MEYSGYTHHTRHAFMFIKQANEYSSLDATDATPMGYAI